jgi:hypothetical protein
MTKTTTHDVRRDLIEMTRTNLKSDLTREMLQDDALQDAIVEAICALYRAVDLADALAPCIEQSRSREALLALGIIWQPKNKECSHAILPYD